MNNYQYQKFSKQLTYWKKKDELKECIDLFKKYHGECEGLEYILKSNRKKVNPKYAIFIKQDNKLRRINDIELKKKISLSDLALITLPKKREGISLFKTMLSVII